MFRDPAKGITSDEMAALHAELSHQSLPTPDSSKLSFEPTTFTSPRTGAEYYQLKVHGFPQEFKDMYEKYRGQGLTFPDYSPHITINKELYDRVKAGHKPNIRFGAPELRNGPKVLHTFKDHKKT